MKKNMSHLKVAINLQELNAFVVSALSSILLWGRSPHHSQISSAPRLHCVCMCPAAVQCIVLNGVARHPSVASAFFGFTSRRMGSDQGEGRGGGGVTDVSPLWRFVPKTFRLSPTFFSQKCRRGGKWRTVKDDGKDDGRREKNGSRRKKTDRRRRLDPGGETSWGWNVQARGETSWNRAAAALAWDRV